MAKERKGITCRGLLMFFLCCMMFLSRPGMESQAATHTEANGVRYIFDISTDGGNRAVITNVYVPGNISSVTVPDKVRNGSNPTEYPVVAIGAPSDQYFTGAFSGNNHILSVTLPDSVCEIYERAFEGLTNLKTISLNGNGIVIGFQAFKGCNNLQVTFRGTGAVKYISGYAFGTGNSNCLDYNVIKNRVDKNSWIGYDAKWNNEATWKALVNSLTPFSISVEDDSNKNWEPTFDVLNEANGYLDPKQIVSDSTATSEYKAWVRKAAKWVDSKEEQAEIRFDVAYNPMSGKGSNDMVFVLDVSGSMYFANNLISGSNYSRQFQVFDQVRSVGKALLDLNDADTVYNRVGATMFDTRLRGTSRYVSSATGGFFTDYASFIKWLDQENYIFNAATGYSLGLDGAADLIRNRADKSRTPSVIFLSDGDPNAGTQGAFPGTSISGYGGTSTTALSALGVTRYSILLGTITTSTMQKVTYIAGGPGTSNDSTKAFASPNAATLQQAFQEILIQVSENLNLSLSDTAGTVFDVDVRALPTATGGNVSLSGASTSWDFSGTSPRQVYTLIIIQNLKRNSSDYNAFFYGKLETNLDDAVLEDATIGPLVSLPSPVLSKSLGTVTIHVHVTDGVGIGLDGRESIEISDTITETGTYTANYRGNYDAVLESVEVAAVGGTKVLVGTPSSYTIEDIRCNYDIWVVYHYPPPGTVGTWRYCATAENGSIAPEEENNIPLNANKEVTYSPKEGYKLDYILVGRENETKRKLSADEQLLYQKKYQFSESDPDVVYTIHVQFVEIPETTGDEWIWGDYRR